MLEYYIVYSWMNELGLDITELNVFAYVLAWNLQKMTYFASKATTAAFFGISERTVATVFDKLTKAGLLIRHAEKTNRGNRRIHYAISPKVAAKFAGTQLQNLQLVYAEFAGTQLQNLQEINNNKTDEYPSGYSKKVMNNVHAEACTSANADAPALPALLGTTHKENRTISTQPHDPTFDEGEDLVPETVTPDEQPQAKDLEPVEDRKKKKSSGKKRKSTTPPEVDFFDRIMKTFDDVPEELAREFVDNRNSKKNVKKTEDAWKDVVLGVRKAQSMGYTAKQFFHFMVYKGWCICNENHVFKALQEAQPEQLDDMTDEVAVALFQQSQRAARPASYSRQASAAKISKLEANLQEAARSSGMTIKNGLFE